MPDQNLIIFNAQYLSWHLERRPTREYGVEMAMIIELGMVAVAGSRAA